MIEKLIEFVVEEKHRFEKNLIYRCGKDYYVFGQYQLEIVDNHSVQVSKRHDTVGQFVSTGAALAWCIADKFNQIELAKNILSVSENQQRLINDITTSQQLMKKNRYRGQRELLNSKIYIKTCHVKSYQQQLKKMIDQTKYLQSKGFNYETH